MITENFFIGLAIAALVVTIITDVLYFRIPNRIFYLLFYLFPLFILISGRYEAFNQYGLFLIFAICGFVLFGLGVIGGGDAKLLSVVALWIGWEKVLFFLVGVALLGGVLSLLILFIPDVIRKSTFRSRRFLERHPFLYKGLLFLIPDADGLEPDIMKMQKKRMVPYGVAIALVGIGILGGILRQ